MISLCISVPKKTEGRERREREREKKDRRAEWKVTRYKYAKWVGGRKPPFHQRSMHLKKEFLCNFLVKSKNNKISFFPLFRLFLSLRALSILVVEKMRFLSLCVCARLFSTRFDFAFCGKRRKEKRSAHFLFPFFPTEQERCFPCKHTHALL